MPKRGTHLSELNARRYIKDAGASPDMVLASIPCRRVYQGGGYQRVCYMYALEDLEVALLRQKKPIKPPDVTPYLTKYQRSRLRKKQGAV